MSNKNHTHIVFIMDCSGSMDGIYKPLQNAMHKMLEEQARKLAGYLTVDVNYFEEYLSRGPQDADPMTVHLGLWAGGGTNIHGPVLQVVNALKEKIRQMPEDERPGHVVVVIMTDGYGGRSNHNTITAIAEQRAAGWDFAFLAAGEDAMNSANLGLPPESMIYEKPDKQGVERMAERLGGFVSMSRSGADAHF